MTTDTAEERYIVLTPAGCFHAVENPVDTDVRRLLLNLLRRPVSPTVAQLSADDTVTAQLDQLVEVGFLSWTTTLDKLPETSLTDVLPTLLPALSERGRVVLTESRHGLFLDFCGVAQEEAEELAVLAAGLRAIADKRSILLAGQLDVHSRAFGIVDPAGNSEIGFWPMHIGDNVFTLTILGIPRFNIDAFRVLVWILVERYGKTPATDAL